jgi:hypothetical protein
MTSSRLLPVQMELCSQASPKTWERWIQSTNLSKKHCTFQILFGKKTNKHPIWRLGVQSGRTLLTHASIPSIRKINKKLKFKKLYWKFFLLLPIK